MEKVYRWGFVGAGGMARHQAQDLAYSPRNRVYGVVSRTTESAQAFADQFGARVFASLEAMLSDEDIDLIYISTPNNWHCPQAKLALEAGKPVLCEKPFTLNAMELQDLVRIARQNKVFLMEAMWIRYLPAVARFRELLNEDALGKIQRVQASFHLNLPVNPLGRIYNLELGGGSLLDVGIYPISFVSLVTKQQPAQIESQAQFADTGVDTNFSANFGYSDGIQATVAAGVDGQRTGGLVVEGEAGKIRVEDYRSWKLRQLNIEIRDRQPETLDFPIVGTGYSYQADEVARCLDGGLLESSVMPLDESMSIMQTLDRIREQWHLVFPGE
jgi:predicted dehydrogenase